MSTLDADHVSVVLPPFKTRAGLAKRESDGVVPPPPKVQVELVAPLRQGVPLTHTGGATGATQVVPEELQIPFVSPHAFGAETQVVLGVQNVPPKVQVG